MSSFCGTVDIIGRTCLMIGNGPSSWRLTADDIARIRKLGIVVCTNNLNYQKYPADYAFAVDREIVWEMFETRAFDQVPLAVPHDRFQNWIMAGKMIPTGLQDGGNYLTIADPLVNVSTGVACFETLLNCRVNHIVMCGYDGSRDNRNAYHGQHDAYRRKLTARSIYAKWEGMKVHLAEYARRTIGHCPRFTVALEDMEPHPLDHLPCDRVAVDDLVSWFEKGCPLADDQD